jgi:hypothetical protein
VKYSDANACCHLFGESCDDSSTWKSTSRSGWRRPVRFIVGGSSCETCSSDDASVVDTVPSTLVPIVVLPMPCTSPEATLPSLSARFVCASRTCSARRMSPASSRPTCTNGTCRVGCRAFSSSVSKLIDAVPSHCVHISLPGMRYALDDTAAMQPAVAQ